MTLRKRLFWLFVPLLLLTLLSAYWLSERILLSRFDNQDRTLLLNDAERLRIFRSEGLKALVRSGQYGADVKSPYTSAQIP